jgi:two-component system CheB/CheR fusion protein
VVITFLDVTETKRAAEAQRLLGVELQHRVKNILATVRAVLAQTRTDNLSLDEFVEALDGRLNALARSQNLLTRNGNQHVSLHELLTDELLAHAARLGENVSVTGPDVFLTPKAAEMLAVAFHELATNAVKYGALLAPAGRINIVWQVAGAAPEQRLVLRWRESGVALEGPTSHRGFGIELVEEGLPYTFGGKARIAFAKDGIECVMQFPLAPLYFMPESAAQP